MHWSPVLSEPLVLFPFLRSEIPRLCRRQTVVIPRNIISFLKMLLVTIRKIGQTAVGYNLKRPFPSEEEFETSRQKDFTE